MLYCTIIFNDWRKSLVELCIPLGGGILTGIAFLGADETAIGYRKRTGAVSAGIQLIQLCTRVCPESESVRKDQVPLENS